MNCKKEEVLEIKSAFSLSDEMLKKSEFFTTKVDTVRNEIRFFGKITSDNNKVAEVNSIVNGVVKNINVGLGDYVKQGQVLAVIQSTDVAHFQKERLDAVHELQNAEKQLQTAKDLNSAKLNSDAELNMAERDVAIAKAELKRINEVYAIYRLKDGSLYEVIAPISGFIVTKDITINDQLKSDRPVPLFNIAEINEIWAVANVNESDISKIKVNYDVEVNTLAFPDEHYQGKIEKIYNVMDPETKAMKFRVRIPNSNYQLKPDINCTVTVKYNENKQLISVPSDAIIFDKSKTWVMIFKDKFSIETREVEVYRHIGNTTYIASGLQPNEKIFSKNGLLIYNAQNE